jgi:glycosyltransferase involved in cell wall biosynthesis
MVEEHALEDERPLVSCIVPARNAAHYLAAALNSVLAQTYRPIEILLIDDGSTDETASCAGRYKAVTVVSQASAGPAAARNLGVRLAHGELVAFLDADDLWHADKLARQVEVFHAQPDVGYCLTHIQNCCKPHVQEEAGCYCDHPRGQQLPGYTSSTLVARRAVFDAVGPFNPALRYTDQVDWFLHADDLGVPMSMLPNVLTYRCIHGNNTHRVEEAACGMEFVQLARTLLLLRRAERTAVPKPDPPISRARNTFAETV